MTSDLHVFFHVKIFLNQFMKLVIKNIILINFCTYMQLEISE